MKDTFYFTHDYNARSDVKIKKLLAKHGLEGYGLYWAIIEDLYNNANALPLDCESIAFDMRTNEQLVSSVINDFGLFVIEDKEFGSLSVQRRLDERALKSKKARDSANKRWLNNANALQTQSDSNAIKEKKEKEKKEDISGKPYYDELFEKYILWFNKTFDRKFKTDTAKKNCFTKFKDHFKGYKNNTKEFAKDLDKVAKVIKLDSYHNETKFKHITPEFILRPDKFEKFLNVQIEGSFSNSETWTDPSQIDYNCNDWRDKLPPHPPKGTDEFEIFKSIWKVSELRQSEIKRNGYSEAL